MFLCRKCMLHRAADIVRVPRRYEGSALPRLNKGSRTEEIIILETPRSTRRPKKIPKKRSSEVQRRLLDEYEQNQKSESSAEDVHALQSSTVANTDEVNAYLDRLKAKHTGSPLTPIKYSKLEKELKSGFTAQQIRDYLATQSIQVDRREKRRLSKVVLDDVFGVTLKEFLGSSTKTDTIRLDKPTLHFLLANAGSKLRMWLEDFPGKLDVDKKNGTLTVTANSTNRQKIRELTKDFSKSISSRVLALDMPQTWRLDKEIMKATDTFLEQDENHQLQVYFRAGQDSAALQAERHVRASIRLYDQTTMAILKVEEVQSIRRAMVAMHTPVVERQFSWTRTAANVTGVQLPFYYLTSTDPKPLKAVQVNARPRRPELETTVNLSSGESIEDVISAHKASGEVVVRFGHVLQDEDAGVCTFSTNLPGQFFVLKDLVPLTSPSTVEQYQLMLQRAGTLDKILITLPASNIPEPPMYAVELHSSQVTRIQLPSQTSDLEVSSTKKSALERSAALDNFLLASNLRADEYALTVEYMGHTWNVHHYRLSTLSFSLPGEEHSQDGQVEWRKVRSRETGEQRQELRIRCEGSVPTHKISGALVKMMQALNSQSY
ncbi:protein of unknown function [Taphrina deformans PYCC 5710]|uniref:SLS1 N-terminal domain-containing protein n=1 Tax=Taphrina deformans (strain PYCC 5710 / ATCC 11124 / CBS 356.35 / IMI 108563 / JCM 9778 / NBRC 8474) TaxID=1097556 RepID=R4X696_TAPDE|nr:protein of unknown function [Taphrina deformans PYCC 5710]|eukprot:CCG80510.1 protein of unknown function [Taphrina deformans PYCC 5710]